MSLRLIMSIIDTKTLVLTSKQRNPILTWGFGWVPPNGLGSLTVSIPRGKIEKAFTGLKLLSGTVPVVQNYCVIDNWTAGFLTLTLVNGTTITVLFNTLSLPFPQINFNWGPPIINNNTDVATMFTAQINTIMSWNPPIEAAFGGPNPILVSWLPRDLGVNSVGNYVFTNVYRIPFQITGGDFNYYSVNQVMGFGSASTSFAVSHTSPITCIENAGPSPFISCGYLCVQAVVSVEGRSGSVISLDGASTDLSILTCIPHTAMSGTFSFVNKINDNYVFVEPSIPHQRILRRLDYTTYNTRPDWNVPITELTPNWSNWPLLQIIFMSSGGHTTAMSIAPVTTDSSVLRFSIFYGESGSRTQRIS